MKNPYAVILDDVRLAQAAIRDDFALDTQIEMELSEDTKARPFGWNITITVRDCSFGGKGAVHQLAREFYPRGKSSLNATLWRMLEGIYAQLELTREHSA